MNSTMEIDRSKSKNVGITSLMKGYTTFSNEIAYSLHNAEFIDSSDTVKSLMIDDGLMIDILNFVHRYWWVFARITNVW